MILSFRRRRFEVVKRCLHWLRCCDQAFHSETKETSYSASVSCPTNQPPAAPEEVATRLAWPSMRRSERTPASRRVKRRPWHSRMRPRDSLAIWTVTAPTWKLTVRHLLSGTSGDRAVFHAVRGGRHRAVDLPRNGRAQWPDAGRDLDAGLVERTTPALGFRIALGYAKDHMRLRGGYDGRPPIRAQHAGTGGQGHGTAATRVAPRIEPRLRRAERVPDGAVAISLGLSARRCPWRRTSRPARRPRRVARRGIRPTHARSQPR